MHRSLRHAARSPSFRAMAWLAWLILALMPVRGMPCGLTGETLQDAPASSVAHSPDHGRHAMPGQADCCGGQGHDRHRPVESAHCAAVCSSILPAYAMAGLVPVAPEPLRVFPSFVPAPSVAHAAPLRPPAG
ncbi:MAG: hypothetical protein ACYC0F_00870 [Rhodanobacter sp.]